MRGILVVNLRAADPARAAILGATSHGVVEELRRGGGSGLSPSGASGPGRPPGATSRREGNGAIRGGRCRPSACRGRSGPRAGRHRVRGPALSVFADSSALVKLYADEEGAALIRRLHALVVSCLARVEVPAAIWRKQCTGELRLEDATPLIGEFEADHHGSDEQPERFIVLAMTHPVVVDTARGLRANDAPQLSSGMLARRADASAITSPASMISFGRLRRPRGSG